MELSQLQMLLAVIETGGYVKAGERLHISHSAIHRQIRQLEYELKERVLVRAGRRLEVTEAGRIMASLARRVIQEIAHSVLQVRELNELHGGRVRVGTGTTMLVYFLPPVLQRFRATYPGVELDLMTGTADQVIDEIERGGLDLGIVYSPPQAPDPGHRLVSELLYRDEFVLAVGKRHRLARQRSVSLAALDGMPFITYSRTSTARRYIEKLFASESVAPRIVTELENEEAIEKMIEIDMGAALLSKRRAEGDHIRHLTIRGHQVYLETKLILPRTDYLPRAVAEFARLCREAGKAGVAPGGAPQNPATGQSAAAGRQDR